MKYNSKLKILTTLLCISLLCSCNKLNTSSDHSESSGATTKLSSLIETSAETSSDTMKDWNSYKFAVPSVSASEVYEYKKLNLPDKINGHKYYIIEMYDEKSFFVDLVSDETAVESFVEKGLYNFEEDKYTTLINQEKSYLSLMDYNDKYIIFGEFVSESFGLEYGCLYYFDLNTKEKIKFFEYYIDPETGTAPEFNFYNKILLVDNVVYFDECRYDENKEIQVVMYSYDINSNNLSTIKEHAQQPMLFNGEVISFVKDENGEYKLLQSLEEKPDMFELKMNYPMFRIECFNDKIYGLTGKNDEELTLTEFSIRDLINDKLIISSGSYISDLSITDYFVSWCDYNNVDIEHYPCIYDLSLDKIVTFDDLDKGLLYWFNIKNDYGILTTRNSSYEETEYYFFNKK